VVVLFFYPKDGTAICTKEACSFRDAYEDFVQAGAVVIGVSSDSAESHRNFANGHRLPFILLADEDGYIAARYVICSSTFNTTTCPVATKAFSTSAEVSGGWPRALARSSREMPAAPAWAMARATDMASGISSTRPPSHREKGPMQYLRSPASLRCQTSGDTAAGKARRSRPHGFGRGMAEGWGSSSVAAAGYVVDVLRAVAAGEVYGVDGVSSLGQLAFGRGFPRGKSGGSEKPRF